MNTSKFGQNLLAEKTMQISVGSYSKMGPNVRKIKDAKIELKDEKVQLKTLLLPRVWTGDPKEKIRIRVDIKATLYKKMDWLSKKDDIIRQTSSEEPLELVVLLTERDILTRDIPKGFEFDEKNLFAELFVKDIMLDSQDNSMTVHVDCTTRIFTKKPYI